MHLKVLFMLMILAIFWTLIESRLFGISRYIQALEPYSGLSPDYFERYKQGLNMFRRELYKNPELAKSHLGAALDSAREMTLCTRTADSSVQGDLDAKITEIRMDLLKRIRG